MGVIKLQKVGNIRDFGGIKNKEGKTIKAGLFIRSGHFSFSTKKDRKTIVEKYDLKTIIDLRTDYELAEKPDKVPQGVEYIHIPVLTAQQVGITHEKRVSIASLKTMLDFTDIYRNLIKNKDAVEKMKEVFQIIANTEKSHPILWHCSAGKDRCGLISAIFLSILDVDYSEILKDYLLSNDKVVKFKVKVLPIFAFLVTWKKIVFQRVKNALQSKKEFLDAAFDEIKSNYGSIDNFIKNGLGITDEMKKTMKEKYLE